MQDSKNSTSDGDEKHDKLLENEENPEVRLDSNSLPPNFDLGTAEGTPRSVRESPIRDYSQVFAHLPQSAFVIDLDGIVRATNRQFCLQIGCKQEEAVGKSLDTYLKLVGDSSENADPRRSIDHYIVEAIQQKGATYRAEFLYKNEDGEDVNIEFAGSPIFNEDENIVGVVGLGYDITVIRKLRSSLESCQTTIEAHKLSLDRQMGDRIKEVKQRAKMLEELSITDELTKLYNRRFLFKRVAEEIHRSSRYGTPFSLVTLDIDHFKKINDTYGHMAGDMVLYELAGILRGSIRQVDLVARTGGEEFAILLPSVREGHAFIFCERVRLKVSEFEFTSLPEGRQVTISLGIADYPREGLNNIDDLVNLSDAALYKAKETRNATVCSLNIGDDSPLEAID